MNHLPLSAGLVFSATMLLTLYLFAKAFHFRRGPLLGLDIWVLFQGILGIQDFYTTTDTIPPRLAAALMPPLAMILILFSTSRGRKFIHQMDNRYLTLLHTIRVPVEIVLFSLMLAGAVPSSITFEGTNFDILSGLTASVVFYLFYVRKAIGRRLMLAWNIICTALLLNVVITALLSTPSPFQQLAFDRPNTAILHFPFHWLPSVVVPIVLFSHLVAIAQLISSAGTAGRSRDRLQPGRMRKASHVSLAMREMAE